MKFTLPLSMSSPSDSPDPIEEEKSSTSSLLIVENTEHQRIELHFRGPLVSPPEIQHILLALYHMSDRYDTCLVYINTPGGDLFSLVELMGALQKFATVITVATGSVASAGFFLWSTGDIRVVQPYTSLMVHREAYGGGGKTDQHIDRANHIKEVCDELVHNVCQDLITEDEYDKAKYTEVFISGSEMIRRGQAISWTDFIKADSEPVEMNAVSVIDGRQYLLTGDQNKAVCLDTNEVVDINKAVYGWYSRKESTAECEQPCYSYEERLAENEDDDGYAYPALTQFVEEL